MVVHSTEKVGRGKIAGFERNVFFVGLTSFLTDTSTKMIYSVMPLFLLSIGASKTSISLIEGVAESTASLFKAFSGYWSDKIGKNKPFMIVGYGLTALLTPLYFLARTPLSILCIRFVERVGKGIRTAPRDRLISNSVSRSEAGLNFGFHKAMDNSGAILGPLLAFLWLYFFPTDYAHLFLWATIPAVLGVVSIVAFTHDVKTKGSGKDTSFHIGSLPKRFYFFLAIVFIFTLGNSADALLLVKTTETGINKSYIPFVYMLFNVVSVVLSIPIGKWSDRVGRETLIVLGFFVYALVYFLFGRFNQIQIYIVLFMLYGVYSALTDTCQKALVSDLVSEKLRGTGYGLYHAVLGITLLPASLIAGLLYDKVDANAPFYFGSLMAFAAALLMVVFLLVGKRKTPSVL